MPRPGSIRRPQGVNNPRAAQTLGHGGHRLTQWGETGQKIPFSPFLCRQRGLETGRGRERGGGRGKGGEEESVCDTFSLSLSYQQFITKKKQICFSATGNRSSEVTDVNFLLFFLLRNAFCKYPSSNSLLPDATSPFSVMFWGGCRGQIPGCHQALMIIENFFFSSPLFLRVGVSVDLLVF